MSKKGQNKLDPKPFDFTESGSLNDTPGNFNNVVISIDSILFLWGNKNFIIQIDSKKGIKKKILNQWSFSETGSFNHSARHYYDYLALHKSFSQNSTYDDLPPNHKLLTKKNDNNHESRNSIVIDESRRMGQLILDIYNNRIKLLQLDPWQFEGLIAELLFKQGFKVSLTKRTRDGGYDIRAFYEIPSQAPLKWLVECKRFSEKKVGVDTVRSFKEVIHSENANRGIIATTSGFTNEAVKKQQQSPYLLDFRDKDAIMDWVSKYANNYLG